MSYLKELRIYKKLTQIEASIMLGVSLRSYIMYENDESRLNTRKYCDMVNILEMYMPIDETHGIVTVKDIKKACRAVFPSYPIERCVLLGAYADGTESETSAVELLIFSDAEYLGICIIIEKLKNELHKNIILVDSRSYFNDPKALQKLSKSGKKVYRQASAK